MIGKDRGHKVTDVEFRRASCRQRSGEHPLAAFTATAWVGYLEGEWRGAVGLGQAYGI